MNMDSESRPGSRDAVSPLADLPLALTSFGAARLDNALYVYGGHTGGSHSYSTAEHSNQLLRLDLDSEGSRWQPVSEGPRLQGLALVAQDGRLIRVGGFTARNAKDEPHDLHSTDSVAAWDAGTRTWTELPPLPEPRSSHDAALIGHTLYVVGGWQLRDPDESHWHSTAWSLDLSQSESSWQPLPKPGIRRRALAVAEHEGQLYVIGGMDHDSGPTPAVEIYDPATQRWSHGPSLAGQPMAGFGAAAISVGGRLWVSTIDGQIQQLANAGTEWTVAGTTRDARFFHRLLPIGERTLVAIGGANMTSGKFKSPETIQLH